MFSASSGQQRVRTTTEYKIESDVQFDRFTMKALKIDIRQGLRSCKSRANILQK